MSRMFCNAFMGLVIFIGLAIPVFSMDKDDLRREVIDSKDRESMQELGVKELKLGEYQDGKSLTDMHGNRVRLEQYILIPKSNQIEFLTYTKRNSGTDTLRSLQTLNTDIPLNAGNVPDIRKVGELDPQKWPSALTQGALAAPQFYCTDIETSVSNDKGDSVKYNADQGNLYKVFADGLGLTLKYDVLYNNATMKVNDTTKIQTRHSGGIGTTPGTIEYSLVNAQGVLTNTFTVDPNIADLRDDNHDTVPDKITINGQTGTDILQAMSSDFYWDGTKITAETRLQDLGSTLNDVLNKKIDFKQVVTFADGTKLSHEEAWLKDSGDVLTIRSYFALLKSLRADNWAAKLSELNHEGVWNASEFGGWDNVTMTSARSIDVIWSPSIFIKALTSDVDSAK